MDIQVDCPASYPDGAKLVFVGDAPDREETEQHEGFVGAAGRCLQRAAGMAGLDWANVGKSNVAKRRPNDRNKFTEEFYETVEEPIYTKTGKLSKKGRKVTRPTQELLAYRDDLCRELQARRPNLVIACGNHALEAIVGHAGVVNYRGSILEDQWGSKLKILSVEHPSYIIRGNMVDFWILAHDLKKAKREMEFPEIRRESWAQHIAPETPLWLFLRLLNTVKCLPKHLWTLDVETRAGTLACFAIAFRDPGNHDSIVSFCIPIQTTTGPYWSPQEEMEIWKALDETCKSNPNLSNQNISYDIYYLLRYGVEPSGVYMDTMLAHSILYPELPKSLDFLASWYLDDIIYWKDDHREWTNSTPDQALWAYNCKDAVYTLRIVEKIDEELRRRNMWEMYHGSPLRSTTT